ncbi:MAG: glycosyltransferase [Eubacteriales bacterium]|nr:glycosyltransferase [Eubacteriales bacterium]
MDEMMVSVLTTAYNHAPYIRQTLDSILSQKTRFSYELLIHDDASTDGTADIIRDYARRYPDRIRVVLQKENQYKKGIDVYGFLKPLIRGKYIAQCEGDDYWCDDCKLQKQVDYMEQHPECVACVHQTKQINMMTGETSVVSKRTGDGTLDFSEIIVDGNQAFQASSLLMRRTDLFWENPPDFLLASSMIGDYPLAIFLALQGNIFYMHETMSVYRYASRETSWTYRMRKNREMRTQHHTEMIQMLRMVDTYSQNRYHALIEQYIKKHMYEIWRDQPDGTILFDSQFRRYFRREPKRIQGIVLLKLLLPDSWIASIRKWKGKWEEKRAWNQQ